MDLEYKNSYVRIRKHPFTNIRPFSLHPGFTSEDLLFIRNFARKIDPEMLENWLLTRAMEVLPSKSAGKDQPVVFKIPEHSLSVLLPSLFYPI